jgi:hypothetical protein
MKAVIASANSATVPGTVRGISRPSLRPSPRMSMAQSISVPNVFAAVSMIDCSRSPTDR